MHRSCFGSMRSGIVHWSRPCHDAHILLQLETLWFGSRIRHKILMLAPMRLLYSIVCNSIIKFGLTMPARQSRNSLKIPQSTYKTTCSITSGETFSIWNSTLSNDNLSKLRKVSKSHTDQTDMAIHYWISARLVPSPSITIRHACSFGNLSVSLGCLAITHSKFTKTNCPALSPSTTTRHYFEHSHSIFLWSRSTVPNVDDVGSLKEHHQLHNHHTLSLLLPPRSRPASACVLRLPSPQ
jgi:hypothetical protein